MWNNAWFIGIFGGIISGIIVFFLTNFISNKISRKDYFQKVFQVNLETTSLLIMSVSEGKIPTSPVIRALLNSLSRNYNVKVSDVNTVDEIIEDLIKTIFETNYIPNDKKNTLALDLIKLKSDSDDSNETKTKTIKENDKISNSYGRLKAMIFTVITIVMFLILILAIFNTDVIDLVKIDLSDKNVLSVLSVILGALGAFVTALISMNMLYSRKEDNQLDEEIKKIIEKIKSNKLKT